MNLRITQSACLITFTTLIIGCATQTIETTPEPSKQEIVEVEKTEPTPAVKVVVPEPVIVAPKPIVEKVVKVVPKPPTQQSTVYFDFDSSQLNDDAIDVIATHAEFLQKNPEYSVILEGHADARGDDSYNELLGSQRVMAIKELLMSENIDEEQIKLVSYGEKKPAVVGDNVDAWRSNRRAIFVYSISDVKLKQNVKIQASSPAKLIVLDD